MRPRRYRDVVLCGHSMGGAISQLYALKYPEELKGIVLIGTGARLRVHPKYLKECEDGVEGRAEWLENRKADYSRIEPKVQQALLKRSAEVGPAVQLNDLLCCDTFDIMDRVHEIRLPAQVVCGSEDVMTPVKYSEYLADKISGVSEGDSRRGHPLCAARAAPGSKQDHRGISFQDGVIAD